MARDFGRVRTNFWNSPTIRSLADRPKLLANYLLTGPHSNSIGAYLLPDAYIADDLGWDGKTVTATLKALIEAGFCERFADGRHIVICKYLEWNPIENPNVGKAAIRQALQLPIDNATRHVLAGFLACKKQFPNGFETVLERFRNIETKTNPETKPETEIEPPAFAEVATQAIQAYNVVARELHWPEAVAINDTRLSKLRKRLEECGGLGGWREAMTKARASPYLRGETKRTPGYEGWTPDLDFFLSQSKFTNLMEGKYDQRGRVQSTGFDALREGAGRAAGVDGKPGEGVEGQGDNLVRLALPGRVS
jgi:hypothetical protein